MAGLYNACDVTALLSRREGTPNVLLESMACGVPVVATAIADNGYILDEGEIGFLIPVEDHVAAAERLDILLTQPALRRKMGDAARTFISHKFALPSVADHLQELYTGNVLARARRGAATKWPRPRDEKRIREESEENQPTLPSFTGTSA